MKVLINEGQIKCCYDNIKHHQISPDLLLRRGSDLPDSWGAYPAGCPLVLVVALMVVHLLVQVVVLVEYLLVREEAHEILNHQAWVLQDYLNIKPKNIYPLRNFTHFVEIL